jgi:hypothetical protein
MKSQTLKVNDKLLITQEFIDENKQANPMTSFIFKLGKQIKVMRVTDYGIIVGYDVFSAATTTPVAENMRQEYLNKRGH